MKHFDLLETKRKHVRKYSNKIPPKELIEKALWKAWKTSPSKNNAMAYQVLIWGPDKEIHKEAIHSLCVKAHKKAEERAVETGYMKLTQRGEQNPFYEHIKLNPYLLTFHSRVAKPNLFYQEKVKDGHFFDQGYEHLIEHIVDSVAVEVGIFAANLTNYILEAGLDMSYNSCFRRNMDDWKRVGLMSDKMVTHRPILMMSIGYAEKYRREVIKEWGREKQDIKPPLKDIIKWI